MVIKKNKPDEDTPFNMAMLFYMRLNSLLEKKDKAATNNDLVGWYSGLRTIYRNIFFKIDKEDRKTLENKFTRAVNLINTPPTNDIFLDAQIRGMANVKIINFLDSIDRELMVLMDKKKMIFPKIDIKGGLSDLYAKYKLKHG